MSLLLLRNENLDHTIFVRVVKRFVHLWSQAIEDALTDLNENILLDECPCPDLRSKMHPYMRHSRRRGNNCVRATLAKNFLARGGGYVTTRYELDLKKLGLVAEKSTLGYLASSEFVARQLVLTSKWLNSHFSSLDVAPCGLKVVNLTLDESRVCQQQVPQLNVSPKLNLNGISGFDLET